MSNYIERNIGDDETVVIYAKKNWLYLLPTILSMLIFLAIAIVYQIKMGELFDETMITIWGWILFVFAGVVPFLRRLFKLLSIQIALTNRRMVGKEGILKLHTLDVPIDKLDHVEVSAGVFGNILHYYTLKVISVGGASMNTRRARVKDDNMFMGISNAQQFKNAVTAAIEQHADEARKKQAEEIARAMGR